MKLRKQSREDRAQRRRFTLYTAGIVTYPRSPKGKHHKQLLGCGELDRKRGANFPGRSWAAMTERVRLRAWPSSTAHTGREERLRSAARTCGYAEC